MSADADTRPTMARMFATCSSTVDKPNTWRCASKIVSGTRQNVFPVAVTSDGRRILVNSFVAEVTPPLTLIVNSKPKR